MWHAWLTAAPRPGGRKGTGVSASVPFAHHLGRQPGLPKPSLSATSLPHCHLRQSHQWLAAAHLSRSWSDVSRRLK